MLGILKQISETNIIDDIQHTMSQIMLQHKSQINLLCFISNWLNQITPDVNLQLQTTKLSFSLQVSSNFIKDIVIKFYIEKRFNYVLKIKSKMEFLFQRYRIVLLMPTFVLRSV